MEMTMSTERESNSKTGAEHKNNGMENDEAMQSWGTLQGQAMHTFYSSKKSLIADKK